LIKIEISLFFAILYKFSIVLYDLMNYQKELIDLVSGINKLQELELNQYQYSKLKKRILKLFA